MENKINTADQNAVTQPIPTQENHKVNYWMISTIVLLVILAACGLYILNLTMLSNSLNSEQTPVPSNSVPLTTETPTDRAPDIVWKTQTIPIQYEGAGLPGYRDSKTANLEMKIPSDWEIQTSPVTTDPAISSIKNCSISTITSKDQTMKVVFAPVCTGWTYKQERWPGDARVVNKQIRTDQSGTRNFYRVRTMNSINSYNYVDAITKLPDRLLDVGKDPVMDALLIGYEPPNESKDDYFFIAAHLTADYSGQDSARDNSLLIVDQIAASITFR